MSDELSPKREARVVAYVVGAFVVLAAVVVLSLQILSP